MPRQMVSSARHTARAFALKALYETDAVGHPTEASVAWLLEEDPLLPETRMFGEGLIQGVIANEDKIGGLIRKHAPAWPVDQIALVDRNILRIAVFEMICDNSAPPKVIINEAVELAKTFGSESAPRFINGVLGSLIDQNEMLKDIAATERR